MTDITHEPFSGNRENLRLLIEGAKVYAKRYPNQFNMLTYNGASPLRPAGARREIHECGTTACFAGISPMVIGLEPEVYEDWMEYLHRLYGLMELVQWSWLFSAGWRDNHHNIDDVPPRDTRSIWHAIARAEYALKLGVPYNALDQIDGSAPISYLDYVKVPA